MAARFPHVSITAVDLAPTPIDPEDLPPNLHFEIGATILFLVDEL